ncbi:MAG: ABC transporter ATP-binding protein/permease [Myxococcota bacterium]|nr:ABC transporter ATP-binding protein/permease [Myxococcota bacterium]
MAFVCMAVLGLTTGMYAFLMGPALRFLLTGGEEGLDKVRWLLGDGVRVDRAFALWALPVTIVAVGVVKGFAYLGQFYFMGWFAQRVGADLRRAVFEALARISPTRLPAQRAGDLLARFTNDVGAVEFAAFYTLGSYVRDTLQIIVLVGVALWLNWKVALATLVVLPLAVVPAARLTRSVIKRLRVGQSRLGALAAQLSESLGGLRTIQAFNGQEAERRRFEENATLQRQALIRAGWSRGAVPGLMELLAAGAIAATLSFAISTRSIPPEELVSVLTALILVYQPAKDLGRVTQYGVLATVAGERVLEVLDSVPAVTDRPDARELISIRREIALREVVFGYGDRPALDGVSLTLPIGKVVAVVGPSGSGKSTLVSLLLRFELPQQGALLIDGEPADGYTQHSLRRQFGLVTQDAQLFSGSVLDNLRLGRPDATLAEAEAAARVAAADRFIHALPKGYATPIGERGVVLSGGQRQRLALARAVLSGAPVLLLDEATSNLDPESEREVQRALAVLLKDRTALVIAHRLSTVRDADLIYVMEAGRVVESGTHPELLARTGSYARLWSLQEQPGEQGGAA